MAMKRFEVKPLNEPLISSNCYGIWDNDGENWFESPFATREDAQDRCERLNERL